MTKLNIFVFLQFGHFIKFLYFYYRFYFFISIYHKLRILSINILLKFILFTITYWSTHIYIALDEAGERGMEALLDEEIQNLAWKKHGFRTSIYGIGTDMETFGVDGIAREITRVMQVPEYGAMKKIIDALSR